jgi:xanthine dehydrogenase accessory factor
MGSRRTHANRVAALREAGIGDAQLERLAAPVGLDIGARTPEETAISIAAEIVALRGRRSGGRLRDTTLPVHGIPERTQKATV